MATTRFRLSSKVDEASGQAEILARFFHGRIDLYSKTNIFVAPEHWNSKAERVTVPKIRVMTPEAKQLTADLSAINTKLAELRQYINDKFIAAGAGKVGLPSTWLAEIIQAYLFPTEESNAVLPILERYNEARETSVSNSRHYRVMARAFKRFLVFNGYDLNIDIDDVSGEMVKQFVDFLRVEHTYIEITTKEDGTRAVVFLNPRYKKAFNAAPESRYPSERGTNAICEFIKHLKGFYLWAIANDLTANNPFRNYDAPQPLYGTPYYITVEERNHLYNLDLSSNPRLEAQRDIFVFQCVIGCRVSDLRNLTKNCIIDGAVEYIPRKTKEGRPVTVRVPLNAVSREIVDKYKDLPGESLLPFIADQNYNYAIKEMFTAAGLTRMVTVLNPTTRQEEKRPLNEVASSHLARRCFIGNLYKQVKDPNLIGKLSGHTEGSRAFARYRDIDEDMRKELVTMLE